MTGKDRTTREICPSRLAPGDIIIGRHFRSEQRVIDCQLSRGRYRIGVADSLGRIAETSVRMGDTVEAMSR